MAYSNLQIFTVELVGTFILVVFATGSIVLDAEMFNGELGIPFHAVAPFVALVIGVYSFGKVSLAHSTCCNNWILHYRAHIKDSNFVLFCSRNNWCHTRFIVCLKCDWR